MSLSVACPPFIERSPQSASVLANMINATEQQAEWLVRLLVQMRDNGSRTVDVQPDAEREWAARCADTTAKTVWGGVGGGCKSWYNQANVAKRGEDGELLMDGAAQRKTGGGEVLPYTGGQTRYAELCEEYGFRGLVFR